MELTFTDKEFYAIIKLVHAGAEHLPHVSQRYQEMLEGLSKFYLETEPLSQFILSVRGPSVTSPVVSQLAGMFLDEAVRDGKIIEIPSLGITINEQEK